MQSSIFRALALAFAMPALAACNTASMMPTASDGATPAITGDWIVERIGDQPVVPDSPARLSFGADGRVSGNLSCNQGVGRYAQQGASLTFGEGMAMTKRACDGPLGEQESRLVAALGKVGSAAVVDDKLELRGKDGALLVRATKAERTASKPATPTPASRY
ncbi:META domain-containing protein [Caldimonas sp. KR1-144]|uniref:META domain-containing protein n=1 Tax=Caldimonas sp. KR1-144 TaxID=3400911 RepID=UPI003C105EFF